MNIAEYEYVGESEKKNWSKLSIEKRLYLWKKCSV